MLSDLVDGLGHTHSFLTTLFPNEAQRSDSSTPLGPLLMVGLSDDRTIPRATTPGDLYACKPSKELLRGLGTA
jgi:hypothetical protein